MKCLWILAQRCSVKSIWDSFGTVGGACAVPIFSFESGDCSMCDCSVARPLGPSGVLLQRRRSNADGEVPLIRSLSASLVYAAEVHGFGSCPMSDWIRKSHFKLS